MARGRRRKPAMGPLLFAEAIPDLVPPPESRLPQDRQQALSRGEAKRAEGKALPLCCLPPPQERAQPPPPPGRREDGKLWFDGPSKVKHSAEVPDRPHHDRAFRSLDGRSVIRDVRRGDRWLSWHFDSEFKVGDS